MQLCVSHSIEPKPLLNVTVCQFVDSAGHLDGKASDKPTSVVLQIFYVESAQRQGIHESGKGFAC